MLAPLAPLAADLGASVPLMGTLAAAPQTSAAVSLLAVIMVIIGLIGIFAPVLPGVSLCWGGVLVWALTVRTAVGWTALVAATLLLVIGSLIKYLIPGRQMRAAGVPWPTLAAGSLGGIIGFFVIPVLGFIVGFVAGVYIVEVIHDRPKAWPRTIAALKGIGVSMLIELVTGVLIGGTLAAGLIAS